MVRLPSLEYNIGHPHPKGHWFLLATIVVLLLTIPTLTLVNLVTLGSELVPSLQPQFQPNNTLLAGWWGTHRLPRVLRPKPPKCEPKDLGRGDRFRVSASLFDYTVMSTWNTTEEYSPVQEQKRVEYRGQSFADCFVNNTRFDFSLVDQTGSATVGVVCPGTNPSYPIYLSMETKIVFASDITKDFIGQYYGPGLDLLNLTEATSSNYRKIVLAALEVISTDALAIMLTPHLSNPALSFSIFYYVDPSTDELTYGTSTFTYVNGTLDIFPDEAIIYQNATENLVHIVNHAVNLDFGSNLCPNIFRNASILSQILSPNDRPQGVRGPWVVGTGYSSFYYGDIPPGYRTWAQALLAGKPVALGSLTGLPQNSAMVTSYLCPMYQTKGMSSLVASVFVGTTTMMLSVWAAWTFLTAFIAKRLMAPRIQCLCNECIKKEEQVVRQGQIDRVNRDAIGVVGRLMVLEDQVKRLTRNQSNIIKEELDVSQLEGLVPYLNRNTESTTRPSNDHYRSLASGRSEL